MSVPNQGKLAKEINATIRYAMWSVFRLDRVLGAAGDGGADREAEAAEVEAILREQMAGAADLLVPLDVSVGVGGNWQSAGH